MRLTRLTAAAGLLLAITLAPFAARADIPVPKLTARVIDQTGTLTADEQRALEGKLAAFEKARGSQIAVLLIPTLGGEAIEDFSGRVTDEWKLGRKGVDDGVLFAIAKQERKLRIHTGRGVQGTLTDALSRRIIADIVVPKFRSGDFAGGVNAGVDAIMKAIEGEELALPAANTRGSGPKVDSVSSYSNFLWIAFFAVPIVAMVLRSLVGRFAGAGLTSAITGGAAWLVFGGLGVALVIGVLAFLFTLFLGSSMARGVNRGGWGGGFPGGFGGGGGGFGGGGSGGGGFSGGGGGFDGGGSSGSW